MSKKRNISAVILAGGLSSRMGSFKPLMDLNGMSALERNVLLLRKNSIDEVIVVTGHNRDEIEAEAEKLSVKTVFNESFELGMISSVKKGVKKVSELNSFFILPVDIPAIRDSSIKMIIDSFDGKKIVMPYFDGKSGHPPLIPNRFMDEIINLDEKKTMRDFFDLRKNDTSPLNLFDRGILMDMDNKDQFEEVKRKIEREYTPDFYECLSIMNFYIKNNKKLINHLKTVSKASLIIESSLKSDLDRDLIASSSLLHDILKGEGNHSLKGAVLIESLGFFKVAQIVREHMDIDIDERSGIKEKEIVYFADKICSGDKIDLNYEERFHKKLKTFPSAEKEILRRYENSRIIQARIEKDSGKSLKEIFEQR